MKILASATNNALDAFFLHYNDKIVLRFTRRFYSFYPVDFTSVVSPRSIVEVIYILEKAYIHSLEIFMSLKFLSE